jgi:hypothetical protein
VRGGTGERSAHLLQDLVAVVHLDLERRGRCEDGVVGTHAGVDGVDRGDAGASGGNEATDWTTKKRSGQLRGTRKEVGRTLRHDDGGTGHAEEGTLSGHLQAGEKRVSLEEKGKEN